MRECTWPGNNVKMRKYHDEEWCIPSHDDRFIFEMLNLEGAQAGLSWSTVIDKREHYSVAFHNFDIGSQRSGLIREKVLDGFLLKHEISIADITNDLDRKAFYLTWYSINKSVTLGLLIGQSFENDNIPLIYKTVINKIVELVSND